ncbi:adenylyltransferase/cytidyltransferase family protein [Sphaerotilus sulfidivorans]|uniref:adenylyltransferase/cytidyltransferase family protein n=1 Tax=Sphaerotilus sulfidivorans TaxID=639200 RepID=UPI003081129E
MDMMQPLAGLDPAPMAVPLPIVSPHPTVAITYGTYDLFHIGHVRLFERIRQRYDRLIVAVSTDEFNAIKGKRSVVPFADRIAIVQACRHVDEVIAETHWGQKAEDIQRLSADALVMGSDWSGHFDELKSLCDVVYLPRTEGVSSSELKSGIATRFGQASLA